MLLLLFLALLKPWLMVPTMFLYLIIIANAYIIYYKHICIPKETA